MKTRHVHPAAVDAALDMRPDLPLIARAAGACGAEAERDWIETWVSIVLAEAAEQRAFDEHALDAWDAEGGSTHERQFETWFERRLREVLEERDFDRRALAAWEGEGGALEVPPELSAPMRLGLRILAGLFVCAMLPEEHPLRVSVREQLDKDVVGAVELVRDLHPDIVAAVELVRDLHPEPYAADGSVTWEA